MRSSAFLAPLAFTFALALAACSNEPASPAPLPDAAPAPLARPVAAAPIPPPPAHGEAADGEDTPASDVDTTDAPAAPTLTLDGARADGFGALRVRGKVDNAREPASFFLHTASGCAHETKLTTTTTGVGFSIDLGAAALTDALGCAIDAQLGDALLQTLTVSPGATAATTGAQRLSIESAPALVRASLDPADGDRVRLAVSSTEPIAAASLRLRGVTYRATVVTEGEADGDGSNFALVEVPARAWVEAVLDGTHGWVDVRSTAGALDTLEISPEVNVDVLGVDEDEGGC